MSTSNASLPFKPRVSVILPTFNRATWLPMSVPSVLQQSYTDLELIVVDDGSTDNTPGVMRQFDDPRLSYIRLPMNQGANTARNTGLQRAQGDFIAFQDDDEAWYPDKLLKLLEAFTPLPPTVGVVHNSAWVIDGDQQFHHGWTAPPDDMDFYTWILTNGGPAAPYMLVRRECFEHIGGFEERLPRYQDWELCIRLARLYRFVYLDEPLQTRHCPAQRIGTNQRAHLEALGLLLQIYFDDYLRLANRQFLAKRLYQVGHGLCQIGELSSGRWCLRKAMMLEPANFKSLLGFGLSLSGVKGYQAVTRLLKSA